MSAAGRYDPRVFERLDELPTLPSIVYELSQAINDPMSSTGDVERIMAGDQSMTAKVLKLANSAYYAIPGGVSSLQRAIAYIGYDAIQQLVLSASIIRALGAKGSPRFDLNQFWKHAVGVAMAAETVARFIQYKAPSDLFTAGLVHDMGKVAIYIVAPELFLETVAAAESSRASIHEVEGKLGLPRHTEIGHRLAARWLLPPQIRAVVLHHHALDRGLRDGLSGELNNVVDIVCLANLLVHALRFGNSGHDRVQDVPKPLMERMYLGDGEFEELIEKTKGAIASAENFLKIIGG